MKLYELSGALARMVLKRVQRRAMLDGEAEVLLLVDASLSFGIPMLLIWR